MKQLFLFIFILSSIQLSAQFKIKKDWSYDVTDNCYAVKRLYVGLHYEMPYIVKKKWIPFSNNGDYRANTIGPIALQIEYSLTSKIGITAGYIFANSHVSWSKTDYDSIAQLSNNYNQGFTYQSNTIMLGGQNHIFYNKKVDVFLGAELGFSINSEINYNRNSKIMFVDSTHHFATIHYMGYLGTRFFLMPKCAINANLGIGELSNVRLGIIYRFGY
jgi:hypothetical protein